MLDPELLRLQRGLKLAFWACLSPVVLSLLLLAFVSLDPDRWADGGGAVSLWIRRLSEFLFLLAGLVLARSDRSFRLFLLFAAALLLVDISLQLLHWDDPLQPALVLLSPGIALAMTFSLLGAVSALARRCRLPEMSANARRIRRRLLGFAVTALSALLVFQEGFENGSSGILNALLIGLVVLAFLGTAVYGGQCLGLLSSASKILPQALLPRAKPEAAAL